MANIKVRKLDEYVYEQLRRRASNHGVSVEEEARQIIYDAVSAPEERITNIFQKYFGHENGINLAALDERKPHEPNDFHE